MNHEKVITRYFHELGIPANVMGYMYARTAIVMVLGDAVSIKNITKQLYPAIAKEYSTTPSRVERAIRHAIEITWSRGSREIQDKIFKNTINKNKGKPTNSEFIAMLVDKVRMDETVGNYEHC